VPELGPQLSAIAACGMVALRGSGPSRTIEIHPGVAAAGRSHAGPSFRRSVDIEAAAFWDGVYGTTSGRAGNGVLNTSLAGRAGLAAVPYLIRLEQWHAITPLLRNSFLQAPFRENAAAILPALMQVVPHDPDAVAALALVLRAVDPAAAEARLRALLDAAVADGNFRAAVIATGHLADLCRDSGRLPEAFTLAERMADYCLQGSLGPWTRMSLRVRWLQLLNQAGQADRVLPEVQRLRGEMDALPAVEDDDEVVPPWNIREALLDTGYYAAHLLDRHEDALDISAALIASMRDRHAPATQIAYTTFNHYAPLLHLGRLDG
jgi:hypothetical protein